MNDRLSLPVHCYSQTANEHISRPQISNRPSTWPSYFQNTVFSLFFSKPIISLPSFLRQDTWSLSSLSDDNDDVSQSKIESTASSSLHFPPVPAILWHLHSKKKNSIYPHQIHRLDLESPTTSLFPNINKSSVTDMTHHCSLSIKTFHTQSILFLFGFIFFPCWWYGWYLSSATDHADAKNQNSCCLNHYKPPCCNYRSFNNHHHANFTEFCSSRCAYPFVNNLYHDVYCYSRFNRFLSFVSFFFLLFILCLLVWLYWGTTHHWWT